MSVIYLDNNATSPVAREVVDAMLPFLTELYGNPSSVHTFGGQVMKPIDRARAQVAELVGADESEIIFTSCGTESDSAAIMGTLEAFPEKRHLITTRVEHPAVLNLAKHLQKKGYRVTFLSVDSQGMLDIEELRASLTDDTALVSIMYANNETGTVFPIDKIGALVKEKGAVFHCDAVQAAGKIPIDLAGAPIDLMSLSGHKLHAAKGVGALYIRRGTRFRPFIIGGHQEKNRRGGTENVASIVGMGVAAELARKNIDEESSRVKAMRDELHAGIRERLPDTLLNGHPKHRLPNTVNLSFPFIEGEAILLMLDQEGICASSGSACTSGSLEPSHVLRAMGVPFTAAHGSIRYSLSRYNQPAEIEKTIEVTVRTVERLRAISPFNAENTI
jgi:cysteine desulfurase